MNRCGRLDLVAFSIAATLIVTGCSNSQSSSSGTSLTTVTGTKDANSAMSSTVNAVSDTATLVSRTSDTAPAVNTAKEDIQWIDGDTFDSALSKAMARQPGEIDVNLSTGANQVPARINTWFTEVTDRGGKVSSMTETAWARLNGEQTADALQTRGLFLLELLPFMFQYISQRIHEEATYGPVKNYDAILITNNTRDRIDMLVFKHKEPPAKTSDK